MSNIKIKEASKIVAISVLVLAVITLVGIKSLSVDSIEEYDTIINSMDNYVIKLEEEKADRKVESKEEIGKEKEGVKLAFNDNSSINFKPTLISDDTYTINSNNINITGSDKLIRSSLILTNDSVIGVYVNELGQFKTLVANEEDVGIELTGKRDSDRDKNLRNISKYIEKNEKNSSKSDGKSDGIDKYFNSTDIAMEFKNNIGEMKENINKDLYKIKATIKKGKSSKLVNEFNRIYICIYTINKENKEKTIIGEIILKLGVNNKVYDIDLI